MGFPAGFGFGKAGEDFGESLRAFGDGQFALGGGVGVAEDGEAEHGIADDGRFGGPVVLGAKKPGVDIAGGKFSVADGDGDGAFGRYHVATGENALGSGHHFGGDDDGSVALELDAGDLMQEAALGFLAEGENDGVGLQGFILAGGTREAVGAEFHHLDGQ